MHGLAMRRCRATCRQSYLKKECDARYARQRRQRRRRRRRAMFMSEDAPFRRQYAAARQQRHVWRQRAPRPERSMDSNIRQMRAAAAFHQTRCRYLAPADATVAATKDAQPPREPRRHHLRRMQRNASRATRCSFSQPPLLYTVSHA